MGANALYASLYLEGLSRLELEHLPVSHHAGPTYLNVLRYLDLPQALAMAAETHAGHAIYRRHHAVALCAGGDVSPWDGRPSANSSALNRGAAAAIQGRVEVFRSV